MALHGKIVWYLASHGENDAHWVLPRVDLLQGFKAQFIKIELVALIIVSAHCLRVVIDDDRGVIQIS